MKTQRLLTVLTVLNFGLLVFLLGSASGPVGAEGVAPVLRGRGLEIVDDGGRVRASITIAPADTGFKMPDGTTGYPETVLLRLMSPQGRPNIKIAATERGAGLLVGGEGDPTHVQIRAEGGRTAVKLSNQDGHVRTVEP